MEPEKLNDLFSPVRKLLTKLLSRPTSLYRKLVAHIHFLDPKHNTSQRVAAALILLPIALYAILSSTNLFNFLVLLVAVLMTAEWLEITKNQKNQRYWKVLGLCYIIIPLYCAMRIRNYDGEILFWMFSIIWTTDIFAFFAGRTLGGPKLLPSVSPNKTWSGLAVGAFGSMLIGSISIFMFQGGSITFFLLASFFLSLLEQVSDLCESKIKRICGVKDSGSIIPGHGGVIDRLDGMIFVAPAVWILINIFPHQFS